VHSHDRPPALFDRKLLAERRGRLATSGRDADFLHRRVAQDLLDRLGLVRRTFDVALDLGSGPGTLRPGLQSAGCRLVVAADVVPQLVGQAAGLGVIADAEALPFKDGSLDLVVSCLALQLVNDLPGTLVQLRRALRPDGLLLAALLGGQTLAELREAFVVAESETRGGASPRVAPFADVRELGALLQRAGFALPVADSEVIEVGYPNALALMRDLKLLGWANMLAERPRALLRRATLARAVEVYQERHGRPDGRVKATFEVVTLTGWAPHESQQRPLRPGSAKARLADALGTREQSAGEKPGRE